MTTFLHFIDSKTQKVVVIGWEHSTVADATGKVSPKPKLSQCNAENEAFVGNARVLNAIFNGVDQNVFKLVNTCTSTKQALSIL